MDTRTQLGRQAEAGKVSWVLSSEPNMGQGSCCALSFPPTSPGEETKPMKVPERTQEGRGTMHDEEETRGGRSPENNEVTYTSFPKGTQQYPNPGCPCSLL